MAKLLSIIIPVYNVEKYITKCLQSILDESSDILEKVEVIVVDDGSTDNSGAIADEFAANYPCMKVIHKKNAGVAAARNTGIDNACGNWLYFVDSDDWLEKGGVTDICREIEQNPDADVLFMEAYQNKGSSQKNWEHFRTDANLTEHDKLISLQCGVLYSHFWKESGNVPLAAPWDKVYRRDFIKKYNIYFCEQLKVLDDMVFNYEVFNAAKKVVCRKIKPYHYRRVSDSITNSYKPDRVSQDMKVWEYLISKYFDSKYFGSLEMTNNKESQLRQRALRCRIVKSFSICCRLCFFNSKNENGMREKVSYVKQVLDSKPYQEAFRKVRLSDLEWRLKVMAIVGRLKFGWGVYFLYAAFRAVN